MSIMARALEVLFAIEESLRIIDAYEPPPVPAIPFTLKAGGGMAATEAPRGLLYHSYHVRKDGTVQEAKIVAPTSQNQKRIEDDLRSFLPQVLHLSNKDAAIGCEKIIRHYDPCISCATHFLKLDVAQVPEPKR
jgi:coenzyme F420-reducing hydrogenase alpha subunit